MIPQTGQQFHTLGIQVKWATDLPLVLTGGKYLRIGPATLPSAGSSWLLRIGYLSADTINFEQRRLPAALDITVCLEKKEDSPLPEIMFRDEIVRNPAAIAEFRDTAFIRAEFSKPPEHHTEHHNWIVISNRGTKALYMTFQSWLTLSGSAGAAETLRGRVADTSLGGWYEC